MKPKSFTIFGSIILLISFIALAWLLYAGIIRDALYSAFYVRGDYWALGFILIPILFTFLGMYYLYVGIKEKNTNHWISTSAIVQTIALSVGLTGLMVPMVSNNPWAGITTLVLGIPLIVLMVIGMILLAIGWITLKQ